MTTSELVTLTPKTIMEAIRNYDEAFLQRPFKIKTSIPQYGDYVGHTCNSVLAAWHLSGIYGDTWAYFWCDKNQTYLWTIMGKTPPQESLACECLHMKNR